ncbi:MAG: hypothetical protein A2583_02515 [Bdellovibrionales bacterium RIFOXYD1_FULL_53_11]|nr:MAG: hypothetical protein A2583_02515 [Bdellovibrionales bacterium RIFOXYD1_FULL_53_11]
MKTNMMIALVIALMSGPAWGMVDFRSNTSMSYGKATGDYISTSPTLLNYAEDLSVLYNGLPFVQAGIGGSFRFVRQTSAVESSVGNFKGNRWEIYPVVGTTFSNFWFGLAPVFYAGRYSMSKQTVNKLDIYYREPLGAKLFVSYDLSALFPLPAIKWGVSLAGDYMTYKKYSTVNAAGTATDKEMDSRLKLWSVGLALSIYYGI